MKNSKFQQLKSLALDLAKYDELSSTLLKEETGITSNYASMIVCQLRDEGKLKFLRSEKTERVGRPHYVYSINKSKTTKISKPSGLSKYTMKELITELSRRSA
jgi:predicted transcriptional regulator